MEFWEEFFRYFLEDFFGRIFWEEFFKRNFLGGILTLLTSAKLFEYGRNWIVCQDFGFCQDFVSMEKEGRISILRGASFTWVKNGFFVQFFESKDNLYFCTLLQKFKNTFLLAGITYMTEYITKHKTYWRHARGKVSAMVTWTLVARRLLSFYYCFDT